MSIEPWLKLIEFLTKSFGLPGSMAVLLAGYLMWLLKQEREAHSSTRDKIDQINEKRIETTAQTILIVEKLKDSLQAVAAFLSKER